LKEDRRSVVLRKIIHLDMDAFFASVETKDQPELLGLPVIVGGIGSRSVVAAASYEARAFGVHSAMSMAQAKKLCPQAVVLPPRFERYKEISAHLHRIFRKYTDLVEPLSLDEAWLDVTANKLDIPSATWVATHIKWDIQTQLGLTSSAGVSYNKFLAKIASAMEKPDGLFVIPPEEAADFLSGVRLKILPGVGKVMEQKLLAQGLEFGHQLLLRDKASLVQSFGKFGGQLYDLIRGIDPRPVVADRERKSVGIERTFGTDAPFGPNLERVLERLVRGMAQRLKSQPKQGKTLTLKVRFMNFKTLTKSVTRPKGLKESQIRELAFAKLAEVASAHPGEKVRLLGLAVSGFERETEKPSKKNQQLELFEEPNSLDTF